MKPDDFAILAFAAIWDCAWAFSLWKHWPELVYQRNRGESFTCYWLSLFGIERNEQNCVWLMRAGCILGMIAVTTGSILTVVLRNR